MAETTDWNPEFVERLMAVMPRVLARYATEAHAARALRADLEEAQAALRAERERMDWMHQFVSGITTTDADGNLFHHGCASRDDESFREFVDRIRAVSPDAYAPTTPARREERRRE